MLIHSSTNDILYQLLVEIFSPVQGLLVLAQVKINSLTKSLEKCQILLKLITRILDLDA